MNKRKKLMKTTEENAPYAVIACRWGWINNGFSVMCVTNDLEKAKHEADEYADYRGGKYGVGVFDASGKQVYHSASLYGEKELHHNYRLDTFESVGIAACRAFELGEEPSMTTLRERWEENRVYEKIHEKPR